MCTNLWELFHPTRTIALFAAVQESIWITCQIVTLTALLLFVLCGQVLVAYHQRAINQLEIDKLIRFHQSPRVMEDVWLVLSQFRPLIEVRRRLYMDFRPMLLANICLSLVTILSSAYFALYFVWSSYPNKYLSHIWDFGDIAEAFIRLWLICHINDCIHYSVYITIKLLSIAFNSNYKIN